MKATAINSRLPGRLSGDVPWFFLNAALLLLVIALPSRMTTWFDGLPWTGRTETVLMMVLMPALLILGWRFLFQRRVCITLLVLAVVKLTLTFGGSADGWRVKVYPSETDYERSAWVETYTTLWQADASGLLLRPWRNKRDFPIEWAHPEFMEQDIWTSKFTVGPRGKENIGSKPTYDFVQPIVSVSGSVRVHEPSELVIVASGAVNGSLVLTNSVGKKIPVRVLTKRGESDVRSKRQIDGVWNVSGILEYAEGAWSLDPLLISPDGNITSVFDRGELFRGKAKQMPSARSVKLFQILSQGFSIFLAGLTIFWIMWLVGS